MLFSGGFALVIKPFTALEEVACCNLMMPGIVNQNGEATILLVLGNAKGFFIIKAGKVIFLLLMRSRVVQLQSSH